MSFFIQIEETDSNIEHTNNQYLHNLQESRICLSSFVIDWYTYFAVPLTYNIFRSDRIFSFYIVS